MLILHFDYPSPAAAVAVLRLHALAEGEAQVRFSGLDILGLDVSIPATLDQLEQVERFRRPAAALGLELRRPSRRPPTTVAHLVGDLADEVGCGREWRESCLRAYWRDDADLGDAAVLAEIGGGIGLERALLLEWLGDRRRRISARQRAAQQRRRGIGDVPVLEVNGTFLGADLSDDDLRALVGL